jgi:hypothetical protein
MPYICPRMSGILDSKSRVIDMIVTTEGRRQIADGRLKIEYASFTDAAAFYKGDVVSGSADATQRIYFEACSLPQDQITFEADDSGLLMPFKSAQETSIRAGHLSTYTSNVITSSTMQGSNDELTILRGSAFASQIDGVLASSLDNMQKLYVLGTNNPMFDDEGFMLSPNNINFTVTNARPIPDQRRHTLNATHMESLFNDPRMSNVKNFKYLPPINRIRNRTNTSGGANIVKRRLGQYPPAGGSTWWREPKKAYSALRAELRNYERTGYCKTVIFDPTSRDNRLLGQFFEISYDIVKKLDVIVYGTFSTGDQTAPIARIFFAGKVITDDNNTTTFVHLFTLVFE